MEFLKVCFLAGIAVFGQLVLSMDIKQLKSMEF